MVNHFLIAVFLICFVIGTLYAEDFTTLDGDHYSSATIKRVEPDGLVIAYPDGVKKLKFKNLPPQIGKQYGYNPVVASQYLAQQQASAAASYQAAIQPPQPATISQNIAASIPSSLVQTSAVASTSTQQALPQSPASSQTTTNLLVVQGSPITPVVLSISDTIKTLFANVYISIKQSVKAFLLKWLHILFPWAFPAPTINSQTTTNAPPPTPTTSNAPPPTPEQVVESVLSKDPVEAPELALALEKYPHVKEPHYLGLKFFKLAGTVESFLICGQSNERVEIKFKTPEKAPAIYLSINLKRDIPDSTEEWKINDQRLFLITTGSRNTTDLICIQDFPYRTPNIVRLKTGTYSSLTFKMAR